MEENHSDSFEGQSGADEASADGAPDPIKNLKAEFGRKFENINEQLKAQNDELRRTLEAIVAGQSKPAASADDDVDPVLDPKAYAQRIKEETKREVMTEVTRKSELQAATQSEIMRIQGMYPEFSQNGSEATKLALQKFQSLPSSLKGTPEGAKMVMLEVAAEMGLTPASRRKKAEEDEYVSGGASGATSSARQKKSGSVDNKTLAFAELLGMDISDEKVRKNLEERGKRDKWGSWR
jgi:hypothetical protein